jgi:hypothetical protein
MVVVVGEGEGKRLLDGSHRYAFAGAEVGEGGEWGRRY